jgi:hypothetical protein
LGTAAITANNKSNNNEKMLSKGIDMLGVVMQNGVDV